MSGDELFVTVASLILGPVLWTWWFVRANAIASFRGGTRWLNMPVATVVVCALVIERTLRWAAAEDVRDAPQYVFMYFVLGWAWLRLAAFCFPLAGLHPRDDLIERRNPAAMPAWAGAMVGVTFCYAGGNIGNGPGWWVVVFSAGLATAVLGLAWIAVGQSTKLVDAVTLDRDPAAGWRLGGFLAATGLICGFAVTGNWVSAPATVVDFFRRAWPIVPLAVLVALIERAVRPTPDRPHGPLLTAGILPAGLSVALAVAAVVLQWSRL